MEQNNPVDNKIDNSIAAIWSMMLPGLGQLLKGQVMPGIFWSILTGFGYFSFFWPGLIIHGFCVLDAAFHGGKDSWIGFETWKKKITFTALVVGLIAYTIYRNF